MCVNCSVYNLKALSTNIIAIIATHRVHKLNDNYIDFRVPEHFMDRDKKKKVKELPLLYIINSQILMFMNFK